MEAARDEPESLDVRERRRDDVRRTIGATGGESSRIPASASARVAAAAVSSTLRAALRSASDGARVCALPLARPLPRLWLSSSSSSPSVLSRPPASSSSDSSPDDEVVPVPASASVPRGVPCVGVVIKCGCGLREVDALCEGALACDSAVDADEDDDDDESVCADDECACLPPGVPALVPLCECAASDDSSSTVRCVGALRAREKQTIRHQTRETDVNMSNMRDLKQGTCRGEATYACCMGDGVLGADMSDVWLV